MQSPRVEIDLSHGWTFARIPGGVSRQVDLPHCWNEYDTFEGGTAYYQGRGAYRRRFATPSDVAGGDRVWLLECGGFYGRAAVRLNGRRLGAVDGQYLGFCFDVGRRLRPRDENELSVRLDNFYRRNMLPGIRWPDFLLYGGLAGRALLRGLPLVHLRDGKTRLNFSPTGNGDGFVDVTCSVANRSDRERSVDVIWEMADAEDHAVGSAEPAHLHLPAGSMERPLQCRICLRQPRLWSPHDPYLYRIRGRIEEEGRMIDCAEHRFGCRTAEFRPDRGFFLNGERVELRGVNRHESMPGFGNALPRELHQADARLIKELGLNFVRLSHYPQSPHFLDACDELGILVYAEIATWKSVRAGRWLRAARRQMAGMIERDCRHPSVILWGMGNESRSRRAYLELTETARALDPGRPLIYAENHLYRARRKRTVGLPDVWGLNYELDAMEEGQAASRLRNVLISECSNSPHAVRGNVAEEAKQIGAILSDLERFRDRPYVAGFALWNFNDYATLRKRRYRRFCGVVDAWRVPKRSAALLQAMFLEEPFLKALVDWGEDGPDGERELTVFTNCRRVEIFRNGCKAAECEGAAYLPLRVNFEPGELLVVGSGGQGPAAQSVWSFGPPYHLCFPGLPDSLSAAERATFPVDLELRDARDRLVSREGAVSMSVDGPARLRTSRPDGRIAFAEGKGRAYMSGIGRKGRAILKAFCEGLDQVERAVDFR